MCQRRGHEYRSKNVNTSNILNYAKCAQQRFVIRSANLHKREFRSEGIIL